MTGRRLAAALAVSTMMLATIPPCAAGAAPARAAPARPARSVGVDWTRHFATLPTGAFVMGNPRARVKLVEYLSLSCSHCAAFSAEGMPALKHDYIARGTVSLEVRHAVRDGFDFAGVMLSRCNGPAAYFATSERIFATQAQWMPKAEAYYQSVPPQQVEDVAAQTGALAHAAGFDELMRTRGMAPTRVNACLASAPDRAKVVAMTAEAWQNRKIPGTPSFLINGVLQDRTSDWAALKPKLDAALR